MKNAGGRPQFHIHVPEGFGVLSVQADTRDRKAAAETIAIARQKGPTAAISNPDIIDANGQSLKFIGDYRHWSSPSNCSGTVGHTKNLYSRFFNPVVTNCNQKYTDGGLLLLNMPKKIGLEAVSISGPIRWNAARGKAWPI